MTDRLMSCSLFLVASWMLWKFGSKGKTLKCICHGAIFFYWVILTGHHDDLMKRAAPALINLAGLLLENIPSAQVHAALRNGMRNSLNDMTQEMTGEVMGLDMWFFLGSISWLVEYWQQPSTFSISELLKGLNRSFVTFQSTLSFTFQVEISSFRKRFLNARQQDREDYEVLIAHYQQCIETIPPSRTVAFDRSNSF